MSEAAGASIGKDTRGGAWFEGVASGSKGYAIGLRELTTG